MLLATSNSKTRRDLSRFRLSRVPLTPRMLINNADEPRSRALVNLYVFLLAKTNATWVVASVNYSPMMDAPLLSVMLDTKIIFLF